MKHIMQMVEYYIIFVDVVVHTQISRQWRMLGIHRHVRTMMGGWRPWSHRSLPSHTATNSVHP